MYRDYFNSFKKKRNIFLDLKIIIMIFIGKYYLIIFILVIIKKYRYNLFSNSYYYKLF